MKKFLLTILILLSIAVPTAADHVNDIIISSPSGIWTDSRAYDSLSDAVAAIGSATQTLMIASPQTITDLIIPSNIDLEFSRDGMITYSGSLSIKSPNIRAPDHQIFDATGAGEADFAVGTNLRSSWFENLSEMFDQVLDNNVVCTITSGWSAPVTSNCQVGDDVTLKWEGSGNRIVINAGFTLSNIKNIDAGSYQIFGGSGDLDFLDGSVLRSSWFNRLRTINDWIEDESVTIVVDEDETVDYDMTMDEDITLKIEPGTLLSISAGDTLTIYSSENIIASRRQHIKEGLGTLKFTMGGIVYLDWFGATPDNLALGTAGTDTGPFLQEAIDSLPDDTAQNGQGGTIVCSIGRYPFTTGVSTDKGGVRVVGGGGIMYTETDPAHGTVFDAITDSMTLLAFDGGASIKHTGPTIENINFVEGGASAPSATLLHIELMNRWSVSKCSFRAAAKGLYIYKGGIGGGDASWGMVNQCHFISNSIGIHSNAAYTVIGGEFTGNTPTGIDHDDAANLKVIGAKFDGGTYGILTTGYQSYFSACGFEGCGTAIYLTGTGVGSSGLGNMVIGCGIYGSSPAAGTGIVTTALAYNSMIIGVRYSGLTTNFNDGSQSTRRWDVESTVWETNEGGVAGWVGFDLNTTTAGLGKYPGMVVPYNRGLVVRDNPANDGGLFLSSDAVHRGFVGAGMAGDMATNMYALSATGASGIFFNAYEMIFYADDSLVADATYVRTPRVKIDHDGDVTIYEDGGGIVVTSPNGLVTRRIGIDNAGAISITVP